MEGPSGMAYGVRSLIYQAAQLLFLGPGFFFRPPLVPFFLGTLAPACRASERPMAMACFRLVTFLPLRPLFRVGNIIKNEVLYRIKLHPENRIRHLPPAKLSALVKEARNYSFDFLEWKKEFTLKKHWLAHTKKSCMRCGLQIIKKYCGKTRRRTFFCIGCQVKYPR